MPIRIRIKLYIAGQGIHINLGGWFIACFAGPNCFVQRNTVFLLPIPKRTATSSKLNPSRSFAVS
jgi:hypothetical protein